MEEKRLQDIKSGKSINKEEEKRVQDIKSEKNINKSKKQKWSLIRVGS